MSTPITIPSQGSTTPDGICTITFSAPPLGTSYVASISVTNSNSSTNWLVSVGGIQVGQSFGGGAFGPVNIQEGNQVQLTATGLTPFTTFNATLSGTADSTQNTDWSYPQPQVPSIEISGTGFNVNVTGGTIDIGNDPNVNIFSFQSAVLQNFLISASVGGGTSITLPSWVASMYLLVHTAGPFFTAMTINGASTNLTYMNAPLVTLIGGFVPLTSIAVAPGVETSLNVTWAAPSNNASVWVIGTSQPPQSNTETFQQYTNFATTAAAGTTSTMLPTPAVQAGSPGYVWQIAKMYVNSVTTAAAASPIYLADSGGSAIHLAYATANGTVLGSDANFYWNDSLTLHNLTAATGGGVVLARLVPEAGGIL